MTSFRLRPARTGGHVRVQVFAAPDPAVAHGALLGILTFLPAEWGAWCELHGAEPGETLRLGGNSLRVMPLERNAR